MPDDELSIVEILNQEPRLAPFFVRRLDLDSLKKSPYCALIAAIIGQKITFRSARTIRGKLYSLLGSNQFTRSDIEALNDDQLLSTGMNQETVKRIRCINTKLQKETGELSYESVQQLLCVYGMGKWTIETTLLTINPRVDIFPCGDRFLQNKLTKIFASDSKQRLSEDKLDKLTQKWSPHRGIIAWYIWRDKK